MTSRDGVDTRGIVDELADVVDRRRIYASFREVGSKEFKEVDAVRDLLGSLKAAGDVEYRDVSAAPKDPPDFIAVNRKGQAVAVEVTEFVSEEAVRLNEAERRRLGRRPDITEMQMAQWTEQAFVGHMRELLQGKDRKTLNGGPFEEYLLVLHTDEPLLVRSEVEGWIPSHSFGPYAQITAAFLLFSYEPGRGYPFVPIQLKQARDWGGSGGVRGGHNV